MASSRYNKRFRSESESEFILDGSDDMLKRTCSACGGSLVLVNCRGPDGPNTLCSACYKRYRAKNLRIYRLPSGRLTATKTVGATRLVVTGFPFQIRSNWVDTERPSVRVATAAEHARLPKPRKLRKKKVIRTPSSSEGPGYSEDPASGSREQLDVAKRQASKFRYCIACGTPGKPPDTGPDGPHTLCVQCGLRYRCFQLRLYKLADGRITAEPSPRASMVLATAFEGCGLVCDWERPRVKSATRYQHAMIAQFDRLCLSCRKETDALGTGPDGYKTLCTGCAGRYYRQELCVFRSPNGNVSVMKRPGAKRAIIIGFEQSPSHVYGKYDLRFPIVRIAMAGEHAKFHAGANGVCGSRMADIRFHDYARGAREESEDVELPRHKKYEVDSGQYRNRGFAGETRTDKNKWGIYVPKRGIEKPVQVMASTGSDTNKRSSLGRKARDAPGIEDRQVARRDENSSFIVKATCSYGWETKLRYIYVAYGVKVTSFKQVLKETFRMDAPFSICYKDDDGDLIHVSEDPDMAPMFAQARHRQGALQVQLRPP
eukprot:GFKZ01012076.1.p1 GENE.GFKZ01012076.1~~GFKZ01012076.1.p1  ORF type:complete len:544 (+),score=31.46 GFKZ01012076.1:202-1833(+)